MTIRIPHAHMPVIEWHWPTLSNGIDWDASAVPGEPDLVDIIWRTDAVPAPTAAEIAALADGPEWLAHRKRALKVGLVGTVTAPVAAAWASVPEMIRLHNPQLLSVANQARHAADMTAMAGALSDAQQAIDAAQTVADAEAAAAAVTLPTPAGPEE